jgi:hypothetical protein
MAKSDLGDRQLDDDLRFKIQIVLLTQLRDGKRGSSWANFLPCKEKAICNALLRTR